MPGRPIFPKLEAGVANNLLGINTDAAIHIAVPSRVMLNNQHAVCEYLGVQLTKMQSNMT